MQHPIIFSFFASLWTTLETEKRKFVFSWEMKSVSGHLKLHSSDTQQVQAERFSFFTAEKELNFYWL